MPPRPDGSGRHISSTARAGRGKTTTARLLAKLLNCEKRRTDPEFAKLGEPCNECRECREIDAQNSFDVIEIDAASNRGIDEIRNLKDSIQTSPTTAASQGLHNRRGAHADRRRVQRALENAWRNRRSMP